jgi:hypothetical protein
MTGDRPQKRRPIDQAGDEAVVDFRLLDRPLVRCVGAAASDIGAIEGRLGLRPTAAPPDVVAPASAGAPDVILRYVADLPIRGTLRTVGRDDGAFTDDAFVIRRGERPVAIVPFETLGRSGGEIIVLRGSGAPARLVSLLNVAVLARGAVALHGSAVLLGGAGIVACGWSGSGKTEALLGFVGLGARYVGDEWLHTFADARVAGLPEAIRIQDWHVEQLPWLRDRIGRRDALRMSVAAAGERGGRRLARTGRRLPGARALDGAAARLGGARRHVDLAPDVLFGAGSLEPAAPIDRLFLLETSTEPGIRIEPIDPALVAARMTLAHLHHRRELMGWYWQSRFAFPDRRSDLMEGIESVERGLLEALFAGRPAYRVDHPHRVDMDALARAMAETAR